MDLSAIIKTRETAVRNRDIEATISCYHPQVIFFDVVNELHYHGAPAMRERFSEWLSSLSEVIDFEIRVLQTNQQGNMAWAATLNHILAETSQGAKLDMWWRESVIYIQEQGQWLIHHAHSSVPFDPSTGKASLELKP